MTSIRVGDVPLPDDDEDVRDDADDQPEPQDPEPAPATPPGFGVAELEGKSPTEIGAMYQQLKAMSQGMLRYVEAARQPAPAPEPTPEVRFEADDFEEGREDQLAQKMNQFFESKAKPYVEEQAQQMAMFQYQRAMASDPILQRYKTEADQIAATLTNQQAAQPQTWQIISDRLRSMHHDEIVAEEVKKRKKPAPPHQEKPSSTSDEPEVHVSPLELEIWKGLGADVKRARAYKKQMGLT